MENAAAPADESAKTLHINFYENLKEALMRLRGTIVMYDGNPYYVLTITNHKQDGVFRIYLDSVDWGENGISPCLVNNNGNDMGFQGLNQYNPESHTVQLGAALDTWMKAHPNRGLIRKRMDSKLFNKYRPFPLGMINQSTGVFYLERQPQRHREQGLTSSMITETMLTPDANKNEHSGLHYVKMYSDMFRACVLGTHPSPKEVLEAFKDPTVQNKGVAFHRHFALLRGPCDMLFLAYKQDVIGVLPRADFSELRLGRSHGHCKEVVGDLRLFPSIITDQRGPVARVTPRPIMAA